ncbi:hypothetical protein ACFL0Y_00575 [Patescibacteria group bacterium]
MFILSTLHDPEGRFLPLIKKVREKLVVYPNQIIIAYTKATDKKVIESLKKLGCQLVIGGQWGEARKRALEIALQTETDNFFVCDFDKIFHWLEVAPKELKEILAKPLPQDFLISGRGPKVFSTYPFSWQKTEIITNYLVSKVIGFQVDVLAATFLFNRRAAKVMLNNSREKSWGACVEWPLLVHQTGLKIGYQEVRGLTWEDPDRFKKEIKKSGGLKKWQTINYDSLEEWEKRIDFLSIMFRVFKRFQN